MCIKWDGLAITLHHKDQVVHCWEYVNWLVCLITIVGTQFLAYAASKCHHLAFWVLEVSNALHCLLNCSCALDLSNGVVLFPKCCVMLSKSFVYVWRLYDVAGATVEPHLSVAVFAVQVHPRGVRDVVI